MTPNLYEKKMIAFCIYCLLVALARPSLKLIYLYAEDAFLSNNKLLCVCVSVFVNSQAISLTSCIVFIFYVHRRSILLISNCHQDKCRSYIIDTVITVGKNVTLYFAIFDRLHISKLFANSRLNIRQPAKCHIVQFLECNWRSYCSVDREISSQLPRMRVVK